MVAYEFYWRDPIKGFELIATLPERRRDPRRITHKSVMSWGRKIIGGNTDFDNIFFYQVTIDKTTG
jgi:hypothetical protein